MGETTPVLGAKPAEPPADDAAKTAAFPIPLRWPDRRSLFRALHVGSGVSFTTTAGATSQCNRRGQPSHRFCPLRD